MRAELFPSSRIAPAPLAVLRTQALDLLEEGVDPVAVIDVMRQTLGRIARAGGHPPVDLTGFDWGGAGPDPGQPTAQEAPGGAESEPAAGEEARAAPARPAGRKPRAVVPEPPVDERAPAASEGPPPNVDWSVWLEKFVETKGNFWPAEQLGPRPGTKGARVPQASLEQYRDELEQMGVLAPVPPPIPMEEQQHTVRMEARALSEMWDTRVRHLIQREEWFADWGAEPGVDGCQVPAEVIERYRPELTDLGCFDDDVAA